MIHPPFTIDPMTLRFLPHHFAQCISVRFTNCFHTDKAKSLSNLHFTDLPATFHVADYMTGFLHLILPLSLILPFSTPSLWTLRTKMLQTQFLHLYSLSILMPLVLSFTVSSNVYICCKLLNCYLSSDFIWTAHPVHNSIPVIYTGISKSRHPSPSKSIIKVFPGDGDSVFLGAQAKHTLIPSILDCSLSYSIFKPCQLYLFKYTPSLITSSHPLLQHHISV